MPTTYQAAPDVDVITSTFEIPGFGFLAVNAFVLHGPEPILVDTGAVVEQAEFLETLRSVIDPADLKWIWLTHTDFDHIGNLTGLLAENPELRLLTTYLGVGIMSTSSPLPLPQVYLLNPGEKLEIGDRTLRAYKPPTFDNPSTTGFYEEKSGTLFSSDCFGALLQDVPQNAADVPADALQQGQIFWTTVDAPWIHKVDTGKLAKELDEVREMAPRMVLSSHLPMAGGDLVDTLLANAALVPDSAPFVGPDQAALQQMLQAMAAGPPQ
jgi:flavorubredoxin